MGMLNAIKTWCGLLIRNRASKAQIHEYQQQRLRALLRFAVSHSEFYRSLYRGIDIESCRLVDLPVVTKAAMMADYDHYVIDKRLKLREIQAWMNARDRKGELYLGEYLPIPTSGSTGENALVVYNRQALEVVYAALFARQPKLHQPNRTKMGQIFLQKIINKDRLAVLSTPGSNVYLMASYEPRFRRMFINSRLFPVNQPIEKIVMALNKYQPDSLITLSSMIEILAREQLAGHLKIVFKHPGSFLVGQGEPLTQTAKDLSMQAWNMKVIDTYGATECFVIARSCKSYDNLHLMSDLCILEIVDRKNVPVPAGQTGEKVLLTNLFNFVQPFIRYELTDVTGYAGQLCDCGLPFPKLFSVQGRTDDILYIDRPGGGYQMLNHHVLMVALIDVENLKQYQIRQTGRNELTCVYLPVDNLVDVEPQIKARLVSALSNATVGHRVRLEFKKAETLKPDAKSGKFKVVTSIVGPPEDLDRQRHAPTVSVASAQDHADHA
jgi:phenylacetate-coenzyme A ligase PaaK-like adenylate-forming protein